MDALGKPKILQKELHVTFKNEYGLDGGTVKIEFFSVLLNEVKVRLFEGEEPCMLPIKDVVKQLFFENAVFKHLVEPTRQKLSGTRFL